MVSFYFLLNSSQELVEQEDRWCEGGLNLFPIPIWVKLRCIKNISMWQSLRRNLQQSIVQQLGLLLFFGRFVPEIILLDQFLI